MKATSILTAVAILIVGGALYYFAAPQAHGSLTLNKDGITSEERIKSCTVGMGSNPLAFGAHLKTDKQTDLFVHDTNLIRNTSAYAELTRPNESPVPIKKETCTTLQSDFSWGEASIYTDIRNHVNGKVSLVCTLPDGGTLNVQASVRNCTFPN